MLLKIQTGQNNPILRKKSEPVKKLTTEIKRLIFDMFQTMRVKDGLGLAAPQIGKSLRIIVVNAGYDICIINPQITKSSEEKEVQTEGCLSLPEVYVPVERCKEIEVEGLNEKGEEIKLMVKDLLARIIQHEIDHLDGILIVDKKLN